MNELEHTFENITPEGRESHEKPRAAPKITIFLMRHGESEKDKTQPNRGLTEKGVGQVNETFDGILDSLVHEQNPDFTQWDDHQARRQAITEALGKVKFRIYDSGTTRTLEQLWFEYDKLQKLGIPEENIYLPQSALEYKKIPAVQKSGPGIAKRVEGVRGLDTNPSFRKKLQDVDLQQRIGAKGDLMAWALMPEDEVPPDVERRSEMIKRYQANIRTVDKVMSHAAEDLSERTVIIANSHASIITLAASSELKVPIEELDEVPEAQGIRFDYYAGEKDHTVRPLGKDIERRVVDIQRR